MIAFQHPWLLLAPLVVGACWGLIRGLGPAGITLAAIPTEDLSPSRVGMAAAWVERGSRWGTLALLGAVLAGPYRWEEAAPEPEDGIGIVVALDVSESMRDQVLGRSDRLETALDEFERFVSRRPNDVIGLVTFAGSAAARVPPIRDRGPLAAAIEEVRTETPGDGTALGSAIGVAANRLRALDARSKVVVVITDGESNAGPLDPVTAASAAAALGIRTYTIGVGGEGAVELAEVAEAGGGRHFSVLDPVALDEAYAEIDALETSPVSESRERTRVPKHAGFLWVASLLLVTEGGLRASRFGRVA